MNLSSTSRVGYIYSDGSANHARRVATIYPNGRVLLYEYDPGIDDALSRVTRIADDQGSGPGHPLAEYQRLGLNTFVETDYPEPQLRCDLAHGTGDDPYAGLDRFGRIVDLRWWTNTSIAEDVERVRHGYDRAGNRVWRECPVAESFGKHFDELYSYDGADQLVSLERGHLNSEKTGLVTGTRSFAESWSLDMTGNWAQYRQDTNGDGTWELNQSRTQNAANEILTIGGTAVHVAHDGAGSMRRIPKSDDWNQHLDLTYDAWNRVVCVTDGQTSQTIAKYQYDGRNYRVVKETYASGQIDERRHYYYSDQWQVLEERLGDAETADRQFVWGLRYIDDLVLRDRDTMGYATLDERLYALQDPNWNVTVIVAPDGAVMERYSYQAYGHAMALTPAFANRGPSAFAWESLFTGRRLDQETGEYDYRARLFGPGMGRFRSRDPFGADLNDYTYCANNPLVRTDPSGNDWLDCMTDCVADNDPINAAIDKALLLVAGMPLPKAFVASLAEAVGDTILARQIAAGRSPFTTIPSVISARLRLGGRSSLRMLGRYAYPVVIAYGLALLAVESHCTVFCTGSCLIGCCSYDPRTGNMKDAIINQYFR